MRHRDRTGQLQVATTNRFSAHAVVSAQNKLNCELKRKPKKIYDAEMEYIDAIDRKETKAYSIEILNIIKKAGKKGISGVNIRRQLNPDKIRMWDAAISLLCDDIETFNVTIPHFRYSPREPRKLATRQNGNTHIFNKALKPKAQYPADAIREEYR